MRVNPIYTYNRFNSAQKNKQVSFGLIDKDSETEALEILSKVAKPKQIERVKEHDAVTLYAKGGKLWATVRDDLKETYWLVCDSFCGKPDNLHDLEKPYDFDGFYDRLRRGDERRAGIKVSSDCFVREESAYDEATKDGFGVKVW